MESGICSPCLLSFIAQLGLHSEPYLLSCPTAWTAKYHQAGKPYNFQTVYTHRLDPESDIDVPSLRDYLFRALFRSNLALFGTLLLFREARLLSVVDCAE